MPFSVALTTSAQFSEQLQVSQFLVHFQNSSYPLQWLQDVLKFIQSYYSLWSEPGLSVSNVIIKKHIPQFFEGCAFSVNSIFQKDNWESKNNTWEKDDFSWIILVIIFKKRGGFIWKKWTNQSNFFYWFPWST